MELNLQGRREGPRSANCLKPAAEIIVEDYCFCDNQTYISEGIANNHLAIVKHIILFFSILIVLIWKESWKQEEYYDNYNETITCILASVFSRESAVEQMDLTPPLDRE